MNWDYKTLDQLGQISRGRSKHRPRNDSSLFGGKYPFIQTANVKAANFYITEYDTTYNEKGLAQSKLWKPGTLCITIAANIADTGVLAIGACFPDSIMGFTPYDNVSDVRFVKYCFDILQQDCKKISQGTAQDNLSWEKRSIIKFPAPPIEVQQKIADILSAYDDLIENNQKQIKLLEEAAQRLYREWFVDLRFPGYETTPVVDGIPEGWERIRLSDVAAINEESISKDYPFEYIDYIDIGSVSAGRIEAKTRYVLKDAPGRAKRVVHDGDVIWGMVRPNLKPYALVLHPSNTTIVSTGFAVLSAKNVPFSFLYCHVTQDEFIGYLVNCTNGTAYPAVKPIHFEEANILIPTNNLLEKFKTWTERMLRKIETLSKQIEAAKEARDRLLPKLMSGELEV